MNGLIKNELTKISKDLGENLRSKILADTQELLSPFEKKLESNNKLMKSLENDLSVLQGTVMFLENRTSETATSNVANLAEKIRSIENNIEGTKLDDMDKLNQIISRLNDIENRIYPQSVTDELVNRLVFLESRLAAMESTLTTNRSYPIGLE